MKKFLSLALALLICLALPLGAAAEEWQAQDFTFTVPEAVRYTLSRAVMSTDPLWSLAGITDPASMLKEYEEMGVIADLYTMDGLNVKVLSKESATSRSLWDLKSLSEEERASFLDKLIQSQSEEVTVSKEYVDVGGQPFYWVSINGSGEEGEVCERLIGTLFNGHTLTFDTFGSAPLDSRAVAILEEAAASVKITQVLEKPAPQPLNLALYLGIILVLVVVVLAPIVYLPVHRRREKKRKARMAARMSDYRKTHENESAAGALRFINDTECTKEAIHEFSLFHAYRQKLPSLLLGAAVCVSAVAVAFLFDLTWWLKLLAGGVTLYFLYQTFNMVSRIEKVQRAVVSRGTSTTARYHFYEDGFRVGGIQSATLLPYFQILFIRRHGHYLYLYYSPDNAYLVDQFGFSHGEWEEFIPFVENKMKE